MKNWTDMTVQERIKIGYKMAFKRKNNNHINVYRIILGEFARAKTKQISNRTAVQILKKLKKDEIQVLSQTLKLNKPFFEVINMYLPEEADDIEIKDWIREHIDFSKFKNKMQAISPILKHFGDRADGESIKIILEEL